MKTVADVRVPPVRNGLGIGEVKYMPSGTPSALLFCHTVYDVLSALMSEAAYAPRTEAAAAGRTVDSYYALLVSLHKYWCLRVGGANMDRRPTMTGIFCFDDVMVLGCTLPLVQGMETGAERGKETIRQLRVHRLKACGRKDASGRQILDMTKVPFERQDYGNCAETWGFAMFCLL